MKRTTYKTSKTCLFSKWVIKYTPNANYAIYSFVCENCGEEPLRGKYGHEVLSTYCPNCGAKITSREVPNEN